MSDGRKSFRAISREINVSTPTVKVRYERLVNMGLIKAVRPEIDLSKIDKTSKDKIGNTLKELKEKKKHFHTLRDGLKIKLKCDFCGGPVHSKPKVLRFARFERYFCCMQCKKSYSEKYRGRIEMLKKNQE
jgi:Lrp/AsnC family leucine-responsive transcriptional regulator